MTYELIGFEITKLCIFKILLIRYFLGSRQSSQPQQRCIRQAAIRGSRRSVRLRSN